MFKVRVVIGVKVTVFKPAELAFGFFGAGGCAAAVNTAASAFGADAVFPLMFFVFDNYGSAAAPFTLVSGRGYAPSLKTGMIIRIDAAVFAAAVFAFCVFDAGGRAAVTVVSFKSGAALYGAAAGVGAVTV